MNRRVDYTVARERTKKPNKNRAAAHKKNVDTETFTTLGHANNQGAKTSHITHGALLHAWYAHHQSSCVNSLRRLLSRPWQSTLTWLVIAIAIVLPSFLYLGLGHAQQLGQRLQHSTQISAFIVERAKPDAIESLRQRLLQDPEISHITFITPEQAKQEFRQYSGLGNILDSLESNPLPAVLSIEPRDVNNPQALIELEARLDSEQLIASVQLDITWLKRLQAMVELAQHIVLAVSILLTVGVLLIIGNTIRLEIERRREEIIVIKMVGGTDGFVRCPFLYIGFWYGFGGGLIALLLLSFSGSLLMQPFQHLLDLYESEYSLTWLSIDFSGWLILGASVLGWLGAWLAVGRHLSQVEPE